MLKLKSASIALFLAVFLTTNAFAVLFDTKILTPQELTQLSNDELLQTYKDIIIERKALETFYCKSGLTPKDFDSFKSVLEFIIDLRQEMTKREIEVPDYNDWLK